MSGVRRLIDGCSTGDRRVFDAWSDGSKWLALSGSRVLGCFGRLFFHVSGVDPQISQIFADYYSRFLDFGDGADGLAIKFRWLGIESQIPELYSVFKERFSTQFMRAATAHVK
jgi:hypothetical protein